MSAPQASLTREQLHALLWSRPIVRLAGELGYTYPELAALCSKLKIPRPSGGYWYRLAHGCAEAQPPLPSPTSGTPTEIPLGPRLAMAESPSVAEPKAAEGVANLEQPTMAPAAAAPPSGTVANRAETKQRVLDPEEAAEVKVLDLLRQETKLHFWPESIERKLYPRNLAVWLGLGSDCGCTEARLMRAVKGVRKEYQSFQVQVGEVRERYYQDPPELVVKILLRDGCEWKEALAEAWSIAKNPNPHGLTDSGLRLYEWAKGPKNNGLLTSCNGIGAQAKLRRTYYHIDEHLQEIRTKADPTIQWEHGGSGRQSGFRVWFESVKQVYYEHGPLNPPLGLNVSYPEHADWDRLRVWFYEEVLKPGFPEGRETVGLYDIASRRTVTDVFKHFPTEHVRWGPLPDFFRRWRVIEGIEVSHKFAEGPGPWLVVCQPTEGLTWRIIKERLVTRASDIPLEKRYTLSADSRALLLWILQLRSEEYLMQMTPTVEDLLNKDIGIKVEWRDENLRAYLELLVEEINEHTEFKLRTIRWRHYSSESTRILVKKKEGDMEEVVRAIQALGLRSGKLLDGGEVRAAINALLGNLTQAPRELGAAERDR